MIKLAKEYRAWERFAREQAARAETEVARNGLLQSADYCRVIADDLDRAITFLSHGLPNAENWEDLPGDFRSKYLILLVGAAGFEPTTCSTQN